MCTQLNQISLLLGFVSSKSSCNFVVHLYHAITIVNKTTNTEHKYTKCTQYYNPPIIDTQKVHRQTIKCQLSELIQDQGSSVNHIVQIIKHAWQYYNTFM